MSLKKLLLAAIGSVLMIGAGVTLVSVLGAAQETAPGSAGASNAAAAAVDYPVKRTNISGDAKRSKSGGSSTGYQSVEGDHDDGRPGDSPDSGQSRYDDEGGEYGNEGVESE